MPQNQGASASQTGLSSLRTEPVSRLGSDELQSLARRCEEAAGSSRELDAAITVAMAGNTGLVEAGGNDCAPGTYWVTLDGGGKSLKTATRWTASLDAAMKLVPEGLCLLLCNINPDKEEVDGRWHSIAGDPNSASDDVPSGASAALALCAAALKARALAVTETQSAKTENTGLVPKG